MLQLNLDLSKKNCVCMRQESRIGRLVASCPGILPFSSQQEHCVRSTPKRYQPNLTQWCLEPLPLAGRRRSHGNDKKNLAEPVTINFSLPGMTQRLQVPTNAVLTKNFQELRE